MASKKILLGVGALAAMAIVVYAVSGWPPVAKNDTQGAIGVAKKFEAQQISDQDVVLADPDIQSFLQTDFFYQLVTDSDFQKLYLDGVLGKAMVQMPGSLGDHIAALNDVGKALSDGKVTQNIAAGKFDVAAGLAAQKGIKVTPEDLSKFQIKGVDAAHQVASLTELGRALSDDEVRKNIAAGKFDVASGLAAQKGIKVTPEDLGKLDIKGMDAAHQVASLSGLGRALSDDEVRQHMAAGKFDLAAQTAQGKQIKVSASDLQKFDMQALGAKGDDLAALGRLLQKDAFHKALPYSDTMQKLMVQSGTFKNAVRSGDMNKFAQDIVGAKKKAR